MHKDAPSKCILNVDQNCANISWPLKACFHPTYCLGFYYSMVKSINTYYLVAIKICTPNRTLCKIFLLMCTKRLGPSCLFNFLFRDYLRYFETDFALVDIARLVHRHILMCIIILVDRQNSELYNICLHIVYNETR